MNEKIEVPENAAEIVAEALVAGYDNDAQSVSEIIYEHIMKFAAGSVDEKSLTVPEDWITTASREIVRYFKDANYVDGVSDQKCPACGVSYLVKEALENADA